MARTCLLLVVPIVLVLMVLNPWTCRGLRPSSSKTHELCEPVRIPLCRSMPYNRTRMPNLLHHSTQDNAVLAVEPFAVLAKTRCSDALVFFVCALFAPICAPHFQTDAVPPCRSVCQRARDGCEPLMNRYNVSWPPDFECDRLPQYDKGVCITPEAIVNEGNEGPLQQSTPPVKALGESSCHCSMEKIIPTRRIYMKRRFDYAIRARVKSIDIVGELTFTQVQVEQVIKQNRVPISSNRIEVLWTIGGCACPRLNTKTQYLILGFEDAIHNRLMFVDGTLAFPAKEAFIRKITKWEQSLQKKIRRKKKSGSEDSVETTTAKTGRKKGQRRRKKDKTTTTSSTEPNVQKRRMKVKHTTVTGMT